MQIILKHLKITHFIVLILVIFGGLFLHNVNNEEVQIRLVESITINNNLDESNYFENYELYNFDNEIFILDRVHKKFYNLDGNKIIEILDLKTFSNEIFSIVKLENNEYLLNTVKVNENFDLIDSSIYLFDDNNTIIGELSNPNNHLLLGRFNRSILTSQNNKDFYEIILNQKDLHLKLYHSFSSDRVIYSNLNPALKVNLEEDKILFNNINSQDLDVECLVNLDIYNQNKFHDLRCGEYYHVDSNNLIIIAQGNKLQIYNKNTNWIFEIGNISSQNIVTRKNLVLDSNNYLYFIEGDEVIVYEIIL